MGNGAYVAHDIAERGDEVDGLLAPEGPGPAVHSAAHTPPPFVRKLVAGRWSGFGWGAGTGAPAGGLHDIVGEVEESHGVPGAGGLGRRGPVKWSINV